MLVISNVCFFPFSFSFGMVEMIPHVSLPHMAAPGPYNRLGSIVSVECHKNSQLFYVEEAIQVNSI